MIIGITGSSGAGKSTVCELLQKLYHAKIISADKIAKELSQKGTAYLAQIVEKFGNHILLEDGELNRKALANIIYQNEEKRRLLNNCTFEYIKKEIMDKISLEKASIIAIDAPLLFEANLEKICDITIAVIAKNREAQINRILQRDNIDRTHAEARLSAQHPNEFYQKKCQYTIVNDEKIEDIENQVNAIIKVLK